MLGKASWRRWYLIRSCVKSFIGGSGKAKLGRRNNKSKGTEDVV